MNFDYVSLVKLLRESKRVWLRFGAAILGMFEFVRFSPALQSLKQLS
jgi:hypothetical protein